MRFFMAAWAVAALLCVPAPGANIPRPAPDLPFRLANGQPARLSQWKGKVVVLEFLLTTCPHCQRASKTLDRLNADYAARGVQPVGVAINDENGSLTAAYVRELGLKYPVGWVKRDAAVNFLQHPVMVAMLMPQVVFIDRQGIIRGQFPGNDPFFNNEEPGMRQWVESLLRGAAGPGGPAAKKSGSKKSK